MIVTVMIGLENLGDGVGMRRSLRWLRFRSLSRATPSPALLRLLHVKIHIARELQGFLQLLLLVATQFVLIYRLTIRDNLGRIDFIADASRRWHLIARFGVLIPRLSGSISAGAFGAVILPARERESDT